MEMQLQGARGEMNALNRELIEGKDAVERARANMKEQIKTRNQLSHMRGELMSAEKAKKEAYEETERLNEASIELEGEVRAAMDAAFKSREAREVYRKEADGHRLKAEEYRVEGEESALFINSLQKSLEEKAVDIERLEAELKHSEINLASQSNEVSGIAQDVETVATRLSNIQHVVLTNTRLQSVIVQVSIHSKAAAERLLNGLLLIDTREGSSLSKLRRYIHGMETGFLRHRIKSLLLNEERSVEMREAAEVNVSDMRRLWETQKQAALESREEAQCCKDETGRVTEQLAKSKLRCSELEIAQSKSEMSELEVETSSLKEKLVEVETELEEHKELLTMSYVKLAQEQRRYFNSLAQEKKMMRVQIESQIQIEGMGHTEVELNRLRQEKESALVDVMVSQQNLKKLEFEFEDMRKSHDEAVALGQRLQRTLDIVITQGPAPARREPLIIPTPVVVSQGRLDPPNYPPDQGSGATQVNLAPPGRSQRRGGS